MTDIRAALAQVLTDHGIAPNQNGFHGWRCEHPDRYPDYCHCVPDLLDALVAALAAASPEPERCACGEAFEHPCHGGYSYYTAPMHPFQPPAAPTVEALRDALVAKLTSDWDMDPYGMYEIARADLLSDIEALEAAARADERTRRSGIMTAEEYQEAFGEPAALAAASPEPHRYSPDAMAMGDCKVCGRIWEDHQPPTPPESVEALRDALLDDLRAMYDQGHMEPWDDRLDAIIAAARADERTRLAGETPSRIHLLGMLASMEWVQPTSNSSPSCPWCGSQKHFGHGQGCSLATAIAGQEP